MRRVILLLNPISLMGFLWHLSAHIIWLYIRPFVGDKLIPGSIEFLEDTWDLFLFILIGLRVWIGLVFFVLLGLLIHVDSLYWGSVDKQDQEIVRIEDNDFRLDIPSVESKEPSSMTYHISPSETSSDLRIYYTSPNGKGLKCSNEFPCQFEKANDMVQIGESIILMDGGEY